MDPETTRIRPFYFPDQDQPAPQIPYIQHYNLLCDRRLPVWEEAIRDLVTPGDLVLELGAGTGILSLVAARIAKRVIAIEQDPHLAGYAREMAKQMGLGERIEILTGDCLTLDLPQKADLIICEMLDTALIRELQVPVLNRARRDLLKRNGRVIPLGTSTFAQPANCDFDFLGFTLPLPHFETGEVRPVGECFGPPVLVHEADFSAPVAERVEAAMELPIVRGGICNALRITTRTRVAPGRECGPSHWFNPPLILPVEPRPIEPGTHCRLSISYRLGGGLGSLDYDLA